MSRHQFRTSTVCAAALVLGLLAGCGGGEKPEVAPPPAVTATPTPKAGPVVIKGSDFTVTMPGKAKKSKEQPKTRPRLTYTVWTYQSPSAAYSISRVAYPSSIAPNLSAALSAAAKQTGGQIATSRSLRYRKEPAREAAVVGALRSDKEATVFLRYVLVGRVMYGLIFYSKEKGAKKAKQQFDDFVGSLTFTEAK